MARSYGNPLLVLRVGVVGAIAVEDDQRASLHARLTEVFHLLAAQLERLSRLADGPGDVPEIAEWYEGPRPDMRVGDTLSASPANAADQPVLRVVSGLADGTDQIAFEVLAAFEPGIRTRVELVAVLPSDVAQYRDNSEVKNKAAFNALLERCDCVIELDGDCVPRPPEPQPSDPLTRKRRNRAFRLQSAVLLRQCDLLIAAADPQSEGGVGGTRATMATALDLGIPVVFLPCAPDEDDAEVSLIESIAAFDNAAACSGVNWRDDMENIVTRILAEPGAARSGQSTYADAATGALSPDDRRLLGEFFDGLPRTASVRSRVAGWVERRFGDNASRHPGEARSPADSPLDAFQSYRERARDLSTYYTGLYRGAFLVNYALAVAAVILAVFTLVYLIALTHGASSATTGLVILIVLALAKLTVLVLILLNTRQGNREAWNARAVDYRYLAERLRTFYYLPLAASLRPASPRAATYAAAALRQSVVDWLLQAVVRQAPPHTGLQRGAAPGFFSPDALHAATTIREHWLQTQIAYHRTTSRAQLAMHHAIERWVARLNVSVIAIVAADLVILAAVMLRVDTPWIRAAHEYSPILVFFAAVLPAIVAALNSIGFQSECLRIAERSATMVKILERRRAECEQLESRITRARGGSADPGAWTLETLALAESCAQIVTDEVAEWSVLYSRELREV